MKLYTRNGDDGTTGLFGGERVSKTAVRIVAYGTVDELNSAIGLAAACCEDAELSAMLARVQNDLFVVGGDLATRGGDAESRRQLVPVVTEAEIKRIEQAIDALAEKLPPMKHFILPGGCELAARLHLARSICRRAEREIIHLGQSEEISEAVAPYINRLSDWLFAAARRANQLAGVGDVPWQPRKKS